jgi:hypothetical protein
MILNWRVLMQPRCLLNPIPRPLDTPPCYLSPPASHPAAAAAAAAAAVTILQVLGVKVKLMALQGGLLELEADAAEVVGDLVAECDRNITELAEADKLQYNAYFTQVGAPGGVV